MSDSGGVLTYRSANPFELVHVLHHLSAAPEQPMFGMLILPEKPAREPLPAVVCLHGSMGWRGHHHEHMVRWLERGIAVFRVHSFEARRVASVVEDQLAVTMSMMLVDAYRALELLAAQPRIDRERIGVTGWSLGGSVALYSAWEPVREALAPAQRFAAHLPFYPLSTCEWRKRAGRPRRFACCTATLTTTRPHISRASSRRSYARSGSTSR